VNPPSSPLVAAAFLVHLGLPAGTARPVAATSWAATGFLVVSTVGSVGIRDLSQQRKPILSVDSWGVSPNSSKPPKGLAAGNLELLRRHVEAFAAPVTVNPGTGYAQAMITDAWIESPEPQEIPDPDASYAHYTQDIGLAWVSLG